MNNDLQVTPTYPCYLHLKFNKSRITTERSYKFLPVKSKDFTILRRLGGITVNDELTTLKKCVFNFQEICDAS